MVDFLIGMMSNGFFFFFLGPITILPRDGLDDMVIILVVVR